MATKSTVQLLMPEMGESVTEGTVLEWLVAEGDAVEEGQNMVEVSTDKVDAEVPAPSSGTVAKILVQPDETIEVGKPLAEIDPNGAAAADAGTASDADSATNGAPSESREAPAYASSPAPTPPATDAEAPAAEAEAPSGETVQIVMPEMGESVTEGTVLEWHVAEGGHCRGGGHRRRGFHRQGRRGGSRARPTGRSRRSWSAPTRRSRSASPWARWLRGPRGAAEPRGCVCRRLAARGDRPASRRISTRCGARGPLSRRR